jgi:competence protein ComFC
MSILEKLIAVLTPLECLSCGREDNILCNYCAALFADIPERCYKCRKVSEAFNTCLSCRNTSRLRQVRVVTEYESIAKELVWQLKFAGTQSAAVVMAAQMSRQVLAMNISPGSIIVPVPTTTSRARQRGYDQAKLLARHIARQCELPYLDCLGRTGKVHQIGASRSNRLKQLKSVFYVANIHRIKKAHIVLIDDVTTTGATLEAAAHVLKQANAASVGAVCFAQP